MSSAAAGKLHLLLPCDGPPKKVFQLRSKTDGSLKAECLDAYLFARNAIKTNSSGAERLSEISRQCCKKDSFVGDCFQGNARCLWRAPVSYRILDCIAACQCEKWLGEYFSFGHIEQSVVIAIAIGMEMFHQDNLAPNPSDSQRTAALSRMGTGIAWALTHHHRFDILAPGRSKFFLPVGIAGWPCGRAACPQPVGRYLGCRNRAQRKGGCAILRCRPFSICPVCSCSDTWPG